MDELPLKPDQLAQIESLAEGGSTAAIRRRARLLALAHQGLTAADVAEAVDLTPRRVRYWLRRFETEGMAIFPEARPERPQAARELPEMTPADSMAAAGRKVLRVHFNQLTKNEAAVRAARDVDAVHDTRVATRRLRAALKVFGEAYRRKRTAPIRKGLQRTAKALGPSRDLDVLLLKTQAYLDTLPEEEREGLSPLIERWEASRTRARKNALKYLERRKHHRFLRRFERFLERPGRDRGPRDGQPTPVRDVAPALIRERLQEVLACDSRIPHASPEELHDLRIRFKRLRYTLEFFEVLLGEGARELIEEIKAIQDHLGDLNDAEVASQHIQEALDEWEAHQAGRPLADRQSPAPAIAYLAARQAERHELMTTFPETWARFNRPAFRRQLDRALEALAG